jgi:hypothetical protein
MENEPIKNRNRFVFHYIGKEEITRYIAKIYAMSMILTHSALVFNRLINRSPEVVDKMH